MSNLTNTIVSAIVVDGTDAGQPVIGYRIDPSGAVTVIPVPPAEAMLDDQDVNDILLGAVAADWDVTPIDAVRYLGATEDTVTGQTQNAVMVFARAWDPQEPRNANPAADAVIPALGFGEDTAATDATDGSVWVFYGPEATARLGEIPAVLGAAVVDTAARFNYLGETGPDAGELLADGALAVTAWKMATGQVPVPPEFVEQAANDPTVSPELAAVIAGLVAQEPVAITATSVDQAPSLADILASMGIRDDVLFDDEYSLDDADVDEDQEDRDDLDQDDLDAGAFLDALFAEPEDVFVLDMTDGVTGRDDRS